MVSRSHAARRAAASPTGDFPLHPTLPRDRLAEGVAFVVAAGAPSPDLRGLRRAIGQVCRGPLDPATAGPDLIVAVFIQPSPLPATLPGAALPLRLAAPGVLASYCPGPLPLGRPPAVPRPVFRLDLWWSGRRHGVPLAALEPEPLTDLWDLPRLHVHPPAATVALDSPTPAGVATPSRATVRLSREAGDPLGEVEGRLGRVEAHPGLASILAAALAPLLRFGIVGWRTGRASHGRGQAARPRPRGANLLESLADWLRWRTPLGAGLRQAFADRLRLVDRLIGAGDIDRALKLALIIRGASGDQDARPRLPRATPIERASLDLTILPERPGAPILGGKAYAALRQRYQTLARRLFAEGDHFRAAYIHAKLLGDARSAVRVLEAGDLLREAARVAVEARLEPSLAIRLLYRAGEPDAALALARKTGCFDLLAEESRQTDGPFHAFVLRAWTHDLEATGQIFRALQVTDSLGEAEDAHQGLLRNRSRWLTAALRQTADAPAPELVARALLTAPWGDRRLAPEGVEAAPFAIAGEGAFADALEAAQGWMRGDGSDPDRNLVELLHALARLADAGRAEQAGFWADPALPLTEALIEALLRTASHRIGDKEMKAARRLLDLAGLTVLAADLGKLKTLKATPAAGPVRWTAPPPRSKQPAARAGCILGSGDILVWRESQVLQLLDRGGAVTWRTRLETADALVPLGAGPLAILIQRRDDGPSLLTRFDARDRSFQSCGRVRLLAHHDVTSEGQWLAQIGGEIGALDLVKLSAREPVVEFLWSAALTESLRVLAFMHGKLMTQWVTVDVSPPRAGLMELWTLTAGGRLTNSLCLDDAPPGRAGAPLPWLAGLWPGQFRPPGQRALKLAAWSHEAEAEALLAMRRRGVGAAARFQVCDLGRPFLLLGSPAEGQFDAVVLAADGKEVGLTLEWDAAIAMTCLGRAPSAAPSVHGRNIRPAQPCLLADDHGRLFVVDIASRNVDLL